MEKPELLCLLFVVGLLAPALTSASDDKVEEFDFIVVGAGTAGGALLEILSRGSSFTVLGLDRGPPDVKRSSSDFTGMKTQSDYNYVSPHDPIFISTSQKAANEKQIYVPRFRGIGGTSRIYGMIARKPSSSVLNQWPNGWQYHDMKKYYKRMEAHFCHDENIDSGIPEHECRRHHGSDGPMQVNTLNETEFNPFSSGFSGVCRDKKAIWGGRTDDYNGENHNGCGLFQQYKFLDEDGKWARGGSHTGYLTEEVLRRSNLEVRLGSPVTRIAFKDGSAAGVYYLASPERVRYVAARKEIILSAGSFDTPVLLQVSGVGPQDVLKTIGVQEVAINEEVGKNLWDHVSVPYVLELKNPSSRWSPQNGPFSWMIHANLGVNPDKPGMSDVQVYFMDSSSMFTKADKLCKGQTDTSNEATLRIIDQFPDYRGIVTAQTASIFDRPYVDMGWKSDNDPGSNTIQKFAKMVNEFRKYWQDQNTEWSQEVVRELYMEDGIEEWANRYMESALHPACTCAMGKCSDANLRVKGVQKLRVCDASAFATQVDGNPVATLFAMAEKLGEELVNEYSWKNHRKAEL